MNAESIKNKIKHKEIHIRMNYRAFLVTIAGGLLNLISIVGANQYTNYDIIIMHIVFSHSIEALLVSISSVHLKRYIEGRREIKMLKRMLDISEVHA